MGRCSILPDANSKQFIIKDMSLEDQLVRMTVQRDRLMRLICNFIQEVHGRSYDPNNAGEDRVEKMEQLKEILHPFLFEGIEGVVRATMFSEEELDNVEAAAWRITTDTYLTEAYNITNENYNTPAWPLTEVQKRVREEMEKYDTEVHL